MADYDDDIEVVSEASISSGDEDEEQDYYDEEEPQDTSAVTPEPVRNAPTRLRLPRFLSRRDNAGPDDQSVFSETFVELPSVQQISQAIVSQLWF